MSTLSDRLTSPAGERAVFRRPRFNQAPLSKEHNSATQTNVLVGHLSHSAYEDIVLGGESFISALAYVAGVATWHKVIDGVVGFVSINMVYGQGSRRRSGGIPGDRTLTPVTQMRAGSDGFVQKHPMKRDLSRGRSQRVIPILNVGVHVHQCTHRAG